MRRVRVVVVDDHPDVRGVIKALLGMEERYDVVGQAADGRAGIKAVGKEQPDVVLLDLAMPVMDGLTALPEIRRVAPAAKVVVMSGFGTDATVHTAMAQGADAFLHKDADMAVKLLVVLASVAPDKCPEEAEQR